jgi:hypothetical protein
MRTREQIEAELYKARRARTHARDTIQQRLDQAAAMRTMYAHYGERIDQLLEELHATPTQGEFGEVA